MATYKSKHTGERVDNAVTKIPESLPTEDSFIVVKADGSASEYIPQSQVLSDKLDKQTAQTASDQIYGKLADGSQTMFDVTMGAEPTTIPRRDTAGRIQVADGVSGNDAVNFNQLSAVESSVSGLNIQNGSGTKAIQQKQDGTTGTFDFTDKNPNATALDPILTGQIPYGATGDFAVSFGGKSAAQGKRSVSAGTTTIAKGKYSAAFGDNSVALGNESFVANSVTTASGQGASAFGNSTIASGYNSFAEGNSTVASGQVSHAAGTGTKATSNNQFVIGAYNKIDEDQMFIVGVGSSDENRRNGFTVNKGGIAYMSGDKIATEKVVTDNCNDVLTESQGYTDSSIDGLKTIIKQNIITYKLNVGSGDNNNVVSQGASAAIGVGLNTNAYAQTVLGRYNKPDSDAFFIVGNGTPGNIQNAFEVLNDGRAKVQSAPVDTDDVVRKLELDRKFDKAGGTVTGNMVVGGNFTVQGRTTTVDSENLRVIDKLIEVGKGNTAPLTSPAGLFTPKYDGQNNGGIVYDNTGTAYVGDITLDSNGNVDVNNSDLQPIATRNATITNGNLVKWDGTNHKLIDAGKNVDDFVKARKVSGDGFILYGASASNPNDAVEMALTEIPYTVPRRVAGGQIFVGTPTEESHATTKKYVDDSLVTTPITETETVVVDTTTVNFALDAEHDTGMYVSAENAISLGSTQLQWNDGRQKYKVIWDGVEYICYVQSTTNPKYKEDGTYTYYDWQILGNGNNKLNCYNKDTNIYPFAITQDRWKNSAEWLVYATTSTAATHTIKVIKVEGTYKKVTPEYQYDYLSMLKNGRSNDTLIHGFSVDDDGMSSGILSGNGNQYINDVPVGDKYDTGVVIFGNGNLVHRYKATGNVLGVTITGYGNALHLKGAACLSPFIAGYKNTIIANKGTIHPDAVFGSHNKLTYDGNTTYGLNLVGGNSHTIKNAALSLITGLGNTVECLTANDYIYSNIVGGAGNTVNHDRVIVGGRGNTSDRNNQFIAGTYSAANEKAIVKIGNGTKDARANAFEVLDDNRAKVFGTPTENNDVLRYQDTAVEVETSLIGA